MRCGKFVVGRLWNEGLNASLFLVISQVTNLEEALTDTPPIFEYVD